MPKIDGKKLKNLMNHRGFNQATLAKVAGVSTSLINKIVNNQKENISEKSLHAIADILNVHPTYLFDKTVLGPAEISRAIEHLNDDDLKEFVLDKSNTTIIKATKDAINKGIKQKDILLMLEILLETKKHKK